MFYSTSEVEVSLQRRHLLRLQDSVGVVLKLLSGSLWITQDREPGDIILERGESFVLTRPGNTVISALKDARLVVIPAGVSAAEKKKGPATLQALGLTGAPGRV